MFWLRFRLMRRNLQYHRTVLETGVADTLLLAFHTKRGLDSFRQSTFVGLEGQCPLIVVTRG